MITSFEVEDIKNKLQEIANNGVSDPENYASNWGFDVANSEETNLAYVKSGLFVILYRKNTQVSGLAEASLGTGTADTNPAILAVSTRVPPAKITTTEKSIYIQNVPYTETISLVTDSTKVDGKYVKADAFAIVKGKTVSTPRKIIDQNGQEANKIILDTSDVKVLFEGDISNEQTIEPNNSFALTNIVITFNN